MSVLTFGVIRIRHIDFQGYCNDNYYHSVVTESNNNIGILESGIVGATHFQWNPIESEKRKIDALMELIRKCYPKKNYSIEFVKKEIIVED